MNAAKLIPQILTAVGTLEFQYGYMSTDQNGVNWKRFISSSGEFVLKTRREGANTVCEIIAGTLVVTMKIMANGVVEDIREIPSSRL
jgi:hypothetical protein